MNRIFLVSALVCFGMFILISSSTVFGNDGMNFDDAFANAAQMRGQEAAMGTDYMVRNTTEVLHQENTAILMEIAKLHKEIADLNEDIKEIKDIVEGER